MLDGIVMRYLGSIAISLLLALLIAISARAQSVQLMHMDSPAAATAYSGPLDIVAADSGTACFSLRACSLALSGGASINVVRASDSHACDILTNGGSLGNTANCGTGGDNGQSLSSFLTSTTGAVAKIYDQTAGNHCSGTCDESQSTGSARPAITLNCQNGKPCLTCTRSSAQYLTGANMSAGVTLSVVAQSVSTSAGVPFSAVHTYFFANDPSSANWSFNSAINRSAANSAYHAAIAVLAGGSSALYIDAISTTGSVSNQLPSVANICNFNNTAGATDKLDGTWLEGINWGSTTFNGTQAAALIANQRDATLGWNF